MGHSCKGEQSNQSWSGNETHEKVTEHKEKSNNGT